MKKLRIYLDTSVIGGCCDLQFAEVSRRVIEKIRQGDAVALLSTILVEELEQAPDEVQRIAGDLPRENLEFLAESDESRALRDAYLIARVVGPTHVNDAHHVALATVASGHDRQLEFQRHCSLRQDSRVQCREYA